MPNVFFAEELKKIELGTIILPCEGEGRNAVYAAQLDWNVKAFDFSESAKHKAETLAHKKQVDINYSIDNVVDVNYKAESADVVALIFVHLEEAERKILHQKAMEWLKVGGTILLEAFNPKQISKESGGPKKAEMLYTIEMLKEDFKNLEIEYLKTKQVFLNEGEYHKGHADIIQLIAKKVKN